MFRYRLRNRLNFLLKRSNFSKADVFFFFFFFLSSLLENLIVIESAEIEMSFHY